MGHVTYVSPARSRWRTCSGRSRARSWSPGAVVTTSTVRAAATRGRRTSLRLMGWKAAAIVLALDMGKGALAAAVGLAIDGHRGAYILGVAAVAGHVFPITRNFKGGRGVATAAGVVAVIFPLVLGCLARRVGRDRTRVAQGIDRVGRLRGPLPGDRAAARRREARPRGHRRVSRRSSSFGTSRTCAGSSRAKSSASTAAHPTARVASAAMAPTPVTKAVIPAAGLGTRFLPATKSQPKEMLPIVDRPSIQYVVEEAIGRRPHRRARHHRARQARDRGPLRPQLRARAHPRGAGKHDVRRGAAAHHRARAHPLHPPG